MSLRLGKLQRISVDTWGFRLLEFKPSLKSLEGFHGRIDCGAGVDVRAFFRDFQVFDELSPHGSRFFAIAGVVGAPAVRVDLESLLKVPMKEQSSESGSFQDIQAA